jgi:Domain of unknown function (DUF5658)
MDSEQQLPAGFGEGERRESSDRRSFSAHTVIRGFLRPRRRLSRRGQDGFTHLDWYGPHLLVAAVGILLLCCWDAYLTLELLQRGGGELNPLMDTLLTSSVDLFLNTKIWMTAACVVVLVLLSGRHLSRRLRVSHLLYLLLACYIALICYEVVLIKVSGTHSLS